MARKKFSAQFKAQVALEVIRNESTIAQIANKHGVHPTQINGWKRELISHAESVFSGKNGSAKDQYAQCAS